MSGHSALELKSNYTAEQLRTKLSVRGARLSGNKDVLARRLRYYFEKENCYRKSKSKKATSRKRKVRSNERSVTQAFKKRKVTAKRTLIEVLLDRKFLLNSGVLPSNVELDSIVKPFLGVSPEEWDHDLGVPLVLIFDFLPTKTHDIKIKSFIDGPLQEYQTTYMPKSWCMRPDNERVVTADEILPYVKPLLPLTNWRTWKGKKLEMLIKFISGRFGIIIRGSSPEAIDAWRSFLPKWDQFLRYHPAIAYIVDPVCVVADLGGVDLPPTFLADVNSYPPTIHGPLPPTINGSKYFWVFPNNNSAEHFMGFMLGRNAGIHFWKIDTLHPVSYY
eukprot:TRINITY_DN1137_c0_g1_i1.p1 TRINITY_DN1137_c0_g1~~TRINITY_DN1137_c0_g1_i1.p1  ORF type:complete len:332 (+),score=43.85 TRINITY_DN1137_c0_g1_i1:305-1300(+)